ncbi:MAG: hypothetical protein ACK4YP_09270 [Myxococcota bacterium]
MLVTVWAASALASTVGVWSPYTAIGYDVQTRLMESGRFTGVTLLEVNAGGAPTLEQLTAHDVVWIVGDGNPPDPDDLGDVLADYVDAGGGVVIAPPYTSALYIDGRFVDGGYAAFVPTEGLMFSGAYAWLVPDVPDHPVLAGVSAANAGSGSNVPLTVVAPDATGLAHWDGDHGPAVAVKEVSAGRSAYLALTPWSDDTVETGYDLGTDVPALIVNLTAWAAGDLDDGGGDTGADTASDSDTASGDDTAADTDSGADTAADVASDDASGCGCAAGAGARGGALLLAVGVMAARGRRRGHATS